MKSWQHRKLTFQGKITVIKNLRLPTLLHLFTALPNINQSLINNLDRMFYSFIKIEKIKHKTVIADIEDRGLKMVHLHSFIKYLKIRWVGRFFWLKGEWQCWLNIELSKYHLCYNCPCRLQPTQPIPSLLSLTLPFTVDTTNTIFVITDLASYSQLNQYHLFITNLAFLSWHNLYHLCNTLWRKPVLLLLLRTTMKIFKLQFFH